MSEVWVQAPGFPDYAVSKSGRVRRVVRDLRNHKLTGADLVPHASPSGYASVDLCRDASAKAVRVNRLVCEAFHGPPPTPRHHAAHNDGDRSNNDADNLRWATAAENESDKSAHGTKQTGNRHWSVLKPECRAKGDGHGLAKLTAYVIPAIRADPRPAKIVAAEHGVHKDTINSVRSGRTWRHI